MKTTKDCKEFLVEYFKQNPLKILKKFGGDIPENLELKLHMMNPKKWSRHLKMKPCSETQQNESCAELEWPPHNRLDRVSYDAAYNVVKNYTKEEILNNSYYSTNQGKYPAKDVLCERTFYLDDLEGQVGFVVIETNNGELLLGQDIGD